MMQQAAPANQPLENNTSKKFILSGATFLLDEKTMMHGGEIHVENGKIVAVTHAEQTSTAYRDPSVPALDAQNYVVGATHFNAHTHAPLSYLRGCAHGKKLMIENVFFKTEKNLNRQLVKDLARGYIYDGLRSGVGFFGEHYYFVDAVAEVLLEMGLRGAVAECVADLGGAFPDVDGTIWRKTMHQIDNWKYGPNVIPVVGPHAADTVSAKQLKNMAVFAHSRNLLVHMHAAQTQGEVDRVAMSDQCSPVAKIERAGILEGRALLVHLVHASSQEVTKIARSGATVGFCPASQIIYEKLAPIADFTRDGAKIAVATDCAPSNDSCDVLSEARIAALVARDRGTPWDTSQAYASITRVPAETFAVPGVTGTLAVGSAADFVFYEKSMMLEPLLDPWTNLVFGVGSRAVRHVMVGGEWVLWERQSTRIDEGEMNKRFLRAVNHMQQGIQMKG